MDALKIPHRRPHDYFAEMLKSDTHMARVKAKLIKVSTDAKAAEERRKQRDNRKFGKAVQTAKLQERAQKRKAAHQAVKSLRKEGKASKLFGHDRDGDEGRPSKSAPRTLGRGNKWERVRKQKKNSAATSEEGGRFNAGQWNVPGAKGVRKGVEKKRTAFGKAKGGPTRGPKKKPGRR